MRFRAVNYLTSSKKQTWNLISHVPNLVSNLITLITTAVTIQVVRGT